MIRRPPAVAVGAMLICLVAVDAVALHAEEYKWWRDPTVQQELGLTAAQVRSLERVFASTQAEQRRIGKALGQMESRWQQEVVLAELDEFGLVALVDKMEAMRANRNATRTLMLSRMYRTLSPEQRLRLRDIHEARERVRRRDAPH